MQAVTYDRYGPPEVLRLEELPQPVPKDDEVLIRVRATEATKADCEMRSFRYAVKWFWLPLRLALGVRRPRRRVLGCYFAGEIESAGSAVEGLAPGDPVFGSTLIRAGSYAEYLVVPARFPLARKPRTMTFAEAAALPLGGLNALHFMRLANVGQDEQVLVNGAGGSIGSYAVQIAKAMGAHVTAVDRGDKESGVRALGADDFIDYTARDFTRDKGLYDVVFDMVPDSSYSGCIGVLKPDGRYLCGNPRLLSMLRCTLTNRYTRRTARFRFAAEDRVGLQSLAGLAEAGRIGSIVDTVYPLDQVVAAHRRVETEQRVGAIVLDVHRGGEI